MDTRSAVTAIDAAMAALQLARNALTTENKPITAPAEPEPEQAPAKRILPRWKSTYDGKFTLRTPNGFATVMTDRMHRDQICLLFNLDGEEGIRKASTVADAKALAEQILLGEPN